ncbi:MAG: fibronectin type III domain-containing protein [Acidobacteria bacterium]|nr:fibronectin type III domain-containing protein [Acidobacteriota bacterium]
MPAAAQSAGQPEVRPPAHYDVSPPLGDINVDDNSDGKKPKKERPLRLPRAPKGSPHATDPVAQTSAGPLVSAGTSKNFEGVGEGLAKYYVGEAPPDTNMAVGPNHIVQWVNSSIAVFDKNGNLRTGYPKPGNALWSGFGGPCETTNDGDPVAQYDAAADRWVMSQLGNAFTNGPYYYCIAVSTSPDPTGTYNRYAYNFGSYLNDYPKMGMWSDAYYSSHNRFYLGISFAGAEACAFDRTKMLAGQAAIGVCFITSASYDSLLPSDLDGATLPPAGSPNFFMDFGSDALRLWKFHVDFGNTANSTFTGPTSIPVAAFSAACSGGGSCIPQLGTGQKLDSLADRLMYRLAYRNFPSDPNGAHESLVVNHSVTSNGVSGVRWYEIRNPNGAPTVFQQSTFQPDQTYRWMGSAAMDQAGDIALGYSVSSSSINPGIRYTGRVPSDPLGTMQAEATIIDGGGSQNGGLDRWGDYSAMRIDPSDDCTFWYTTEYLAADGSFNWHTRIASFKFDTCGGPPPPPPTAPGQPTVTKNVYNEVDLSWTPSTNQSGYNVMRCTNSGSGCTPTTIATVGASVTTYNDTTVSGPANYIYQIQAYNSADTANSLTTTVSVPAPPLPAAPSNLVVSAVSKNSITIGWTDNSNNETNFDIERCTGGACTNFVPLTSVGANVTTYKNTGLARRTTYRYWVKARNGGGSSGYAGPVSGTTR